MLFFCFIFPHSQFVLVIQRFWTFHTELFGRFKNRMKMKKMKWRRNIWKSVRYAKAICGMMFIWSCISSPNLCAYLSIYFAIWLSPFLLLVSIDSRKRWWCRKWSKGWKCCKSTGKHLRRAKFIACSFVAVIFLLHFYLYQNGGICCHSFLQT